MGAVAGLTLISKEYLEEIKRTRKVDWSQKKENLYVDKYWEPIMFVFGKGFLGREPFVNLFMPTNDIFQDPNIQEWPALVSYHSDENIKEFNLEFAKLDKQIIRKRINVEKINSKCRPGINPESTDYLLELCLEVMAIFKKAEDQNDVLIGSIE